MTVLLRQKRIRDRLRRTRPEAVPASLTASACLSAANLVADFNSSQPCALNVFQREESCSAARGGRVRSHASGFSGLQPRIWPCLLRLVTKAMSDRLLGRRSSFMKRIS